MLSPKNTPTIGEVLRRATAIVLSESEDIRTDGHTQASNPSVTEDSNYQRDEKKIALMRAALQVDMPIYGIGRGMHILNVAMGGKANTTVLGHNHTDTDGGIGESIFHHIYISPGSKLAAVVGSGGFVRVNSTHQQGIREAQKSSVLLASAYSLEDGVIEALESPYHRWVIGVQFNPERRMEVPPHFDRLFQSLVERGQERLLAARK